ncbi:Ras-related protein Rab-24 [Tritrichomonas foetus]|uniref:Ras-related protein Rab-24 n=1 Tax=Tritrichomonas foetus TaxID=1144522 RepID=A0A1J4K9N9_9EUKA|nr:Ras-related protein Rab-24 [Tritrichomonas foetus]|eukprot:OHT07624.1 Ras-related protein Rab-24 [Tritrichomonas foetus]
MSDDIQGDVIATLKLIVVGSAGVGKTTLISAFQHKNNPLDTTPTIAPASTVALIGLSKGSSVSLVIWDTAGQERFQSISQMFYRDADVCFVCFDSTDEDSIETWITRVRNEVPQCIIIFVATKCDLLDSEQTNLMNNQMKQIAQKYGVPMTFITSAKTGKGVNDIFQAAAECVYQVQTRNMTTNLEPNEKKEKCC